MQRPDRPGVAGHVHRRFHHVQQIGAGGLEGDPQVEHDLLGLTAYVADRDRGASLIEWTGADREKEARTTWGQSRVGVGHVLRKRW